MILKVGRGRVRVPKSKAEALVAMRGTRSPFPFYRPPMIQNTRVISFAMAVMFGYPVDLLQNMVGWYFICYFWPNTLHFGSLG